jgi:predicted negative regulator of RcsB-dependent stress response
VEIYDSEREQVEALRKWWKQNGGSIVIGVVLGLGSVLGWRAWQGYEQRQSVQASATYQELLGLAATGDRQRATAQGERLTAEQASSLYGTLGGLLLARVSAEQGDLSGAAGRLQSVLEHAELPEIRAVAQIQLARVRLAQGQLDEALALTSGGVPTPFVAALAEVRGDVLVRRGDTAGAAQAYREALAAMAADSPARGLVTIKLDDLGIAADAGGEPGVGS